MARTVAAEAPNSAAAKASEDSAVNKSAEAVAPLDNVFLRVASVILLHHKLIRSPS